MSETTDGSWAELGAAWRTEEAPAFEVGEIQRTVRRRSRRLWAVVGFEAGVTAGCVALAVWRVRAGLDRFWGAWLVLVGLSWLVATGFAYWNRRGIWRPAAQSTAAYLALTAERARRKLRTAHFTVALLAAQLAAAFGLLVWAAGDPASGWRSPTDPWVLTVFGGLGLLYGSWSLWFARRARRELDEVDELRAHWADEGVGGEPAL